MIDREALGTTAIEARYAAVIETAKTLLAALREWDDGFNPLREENYRAVWVARLNLRDALVAVKAGKP